MFKAKILVCLSIIFFVASSFATKYFDIAHNKQPEYGEKKVDCFVQDDGLWCCPHPNETQVLSAYESNLRSKLNLKQKRTLYMSNKVYKDKNNWVDNMCGKPGLKKS